MHFMFIVPTLMIDGIDYFLVASVRCTLCSLCLQNSVCGWSVSRCICAMHFMFIVPLAGTGLLQPSTRCICAMHFMFIVPWYPQRPFVVTHVASVRCTLCSLCRRIATSDQPVLALHLCDALYVHCAPYLRRWDNAFLEVASVRCTLCSLCQSAVLASTIGICCICAMHFMFIVPTLAALLAASLRLVASVRCTLCSLCPIRFQRMTLLTRCCICAMHFMFIVPKERDGKGCALLGCICAMHFMFIVPLDFVRL